MNLELPNANRVSSTVDDQGQVSTTGSAVEMGHIDWLLG